jgi:2,6-dihydroxypyridine 3-monooxygenase
MADRSRSGPVLRVAVSGGSLAGLTTALLLRDLGHEVDIFERSRDDLTGHGAGIVAHEVTLRYFVERAPIALDELTVPVGRYRLLDGAGRLLHEEPVAYRFVSWGTLYRALLALYGRGRYHPGRALAAFAAERDGVRLHFADGCEARCDLLVLAEGVQSTGRRRLFPGVEPRYAGYVAWRGTVAERDLPPHALARLDGAITYTLIPHSHILVYPIPGVDGRVERGHRRWNFVWYRNAAPGTVFEELMTDCEGYLHPVTLRPGRVQERFVRELKETAAACLPAEVAAVVAATAQPFIQAVMDLESPRMALGRVCILGDAAFAARPHAAAGTAKACENAWMLAEALERFGEDLAGALEAWSRHQCALGASLVARARSIGDGSQFRCDWRAGDPGLRFGLYEPGDSSVWTRTPRPPLAPHATR